MSSKIVKNWQKKSKESESFTITFNSADLHASLIRSHNAIMNSIRNGDIEDIEFEDVTDQNKQLPKPE